MEQAKALSAEKDLAAVVESQKSYLQGLQARLIDAAKVFTGNSCEEPRRSN